jgi:hypothetical protein
MLPRRFPLALLIVTLGSCATPAPEAPPAPRPVPVAPPRPAPVAQPVSSDWRDWPLTPGNWSYGVQGGGSVARFGTPGAAPALTLSCDFSTRQVRLARAGATGDLTVRTSTTLRALPAAGAIAGNDPLLDAIAYSRGRFVVQQAGAPPLVVPTWTEIDRVIQDCRG